MIANLALSYLIAFAGGAAGVLVSSSGSPSLWLAALAALIGTALTAAGFLALRRSLLFTMIRVARGGLAGIFPERSRA